MCGIVGYVGSRAAFPLIVDALRRLEYRGYDSAGAATLDAGGRLYTRRTVGYVDGLLAPPGEPPLPGHLGIGHTRWATHGKPSVANAHPHVDCTGTIAVVHNGIIENHAALRQWLAAQGHVFRSATDTEVVPHLLEAHLGGSLETAVRKAMELLEGDYALAILTSHLPSALVVARAGTPPLLVGVGEGEHVVASDPIALAPFTRALIPVEDGELAVVSRDGAELYAARAGRPVSRTPTAGAWSADDVDRGGHPHFMHKEIHEQPRALRATFAQAAAEDGDLRLPNLGLDARAWREIDRVSLVGCGTSYHAGLIGRDLFRRLARLPATCDVSSEFRYAEPLLGPGDLCVLISQSGETADTLGALEVARARGARVVGVCNVPGSSLTRAADGVVMTVTGPEIGVASTKAFTAQLVALFLMALEAGRARGHVAPAEARAWLRELAALPTRVAEALAEEERVRALASLLVGVRDVFFLGRGVHYPVALEGALKLKEIAYVRAEAFPAGEMKHGPLALIDRHTVTIALVPPGPMHAKMLSTIEEVRARDGQVVALATAGDEAVAALADHVLRVPEVAEPLLGCVLAVPLQLLAYHVAVLAGRDVDRPRNLAKSVTVE